MNKEELNRQHRENWKERSKKSRSFGAEVSKQNSASVVDLFPEPVMAWKVVISLPFNSVVSKNLAYKRGRNNWRYLQESARQYMDAISFSLKAGLKSVTVKQNKVWIDIFVEKPQQNFDAINTIDVICDAIKTAVGVDDKWYSIRRLDWSINKHDPYIFVGISQEDVEDSKTCQYCGLIKPLPEFTIDRSKKDGRAHVCQDCRLTRKHDQTENILWGG